MEYLGKVQDASGQVKPTAAATAIPDADCRRPSLRGSHLISADLTFALEHRCAALLLSSLLGWPIVSGLRAPEGQVTNRDDEVVGEMDVGRGYIKNNFGSVVAEASGCTSHCTVGLSGRGACELACSL